jgi:hypothetical protein
MLRFSHISKRYGWNLHKRDQELSLSIENPTDQDYLNLIRYVAIYAKGELNNIKKYRKEKKHTNISVVLQFKMDDV